MKKNLFTLGFILLFISSVFAQRNVKDVTVHMKDGSTEKGLFVPDKGYPWLDQKSISIFDESLRNEKKIKKKQKTKYKAKDIVGYEYDNRFFESKKVMIAGGSDYSSALGGLPKYALLERIVEGKINIYKAYGYPPKVISGVSFDEVRKDIREKPEYFLMKESDGKMKSMMNANITKWIKDSDKVSKAYADGAYGNMKRKKGKKLGNFLKGQIDNARPDISIQVISDYNEDMAKE